MSDHVSHLPGCLGELVRRGHPKAALILLAERGGATVYVPKTPKPGQPLVELIGLDAAMVLAELRPGGDHVEVPLATNRYALKQRILAAVPLGTREIARLLGTTERHVRRVRALTRPDPNQLSLLDLIP